MKRLLIIQLDDPYFLFETLQVLEKNRNAFKEFELNILVNEKSLSVLGQGLTPVINGITTDINQTLKSKYDISVNLSMDESSWEMHANVKSDIKIGPYFKNGHLNVADMWSAYLLTLKAKAPFLTFHLQEIYKNILGVKGINKSKKNPTSINRIAFGSFNVNLFSGQEQEKLVNSINQAFPNISIMALSEVDTISDLGQTVYIGPSNVEALQICEYGAKGIFIGSHFQGFNLLPTGDGHLYISSRGEKIHASEISTIIKSELSGERHHYETPHSVYVTVEEHFSGGHFRSLNRSDDNYPFYQSHVVLWNFLLNLLDTNLEITKCSQSQVKLLQQNQEVIRKLIRIYDYAMASIDTIHTESKRPNADSLKIQVEMQSLREIDALTDQISQTHSFLRPILDYYRIRRGQNHGPTLFEQSQHSFLAYSEEHQAMKAMEELFSVTLRKNEANI